MKTLLKLRSISCICILADFSYSAQALWLICETGQKVSPNAHLYSCF